MAYQHLAWPGLSLSLKAIAKERRRVASVLKAVTDNPKLYKRPKMVRDVFSKYLADLDTGAKVLRDAQRAAEGVTKGKRRRRVDRVSTSS